MSPPFTHIHAWHPFRLRCSGWIVLWEKKAKPQLAHIAPRDPKDWCKATLAWENGQEPQAWPAWSLWTWWGCDKGRCEMNEVMTINFSYGKFLQEPVLLITKKKKKNQLIWSKTMNHSIQNHHILILFKRCVFKDLWFKVLFSLLSVL